MTPAPRLGIAEIKPQLVRRMGELVAQLCPGARREGDHWVAPNPRRAEERGGSFIVWKNGAWKEYDAGDAEKGDVIDLIIYTGQAADRAGALKWAKDWLGISGATAPEIVKLQAEAKAEDARARLAEARRREQLVKLARGLWLGAGELVPGTPAWIYLEDARGIPLQRLVRDGGLRSLRAHPRLKYQWPAPDDTPVEWRARRPRSGEEFFPALIASMSPIGGGMNSGLHRTYLARDGLSKARVIKAKKMIGQQLGCAIKVWRGESGLSASEAERKKFKGPVAITEGIENALSIAASAPEYRVWACGSLAGLCSVEWHACVSEFVIFKDNDPELLPTGKPHPAHAAIAELAARLAQRGPVKIAQAPIGKDANELLNA